MEGLATDVLRELKRREIKNRIIIIAICGVLLFVTNALWFAVWNQPPKEKEEITFEIEENDNDNIQSENEKSE